MFNMKSLLLLCLLPLMGWAQSHLTARLNEPGILKILKLVADYNLQANNADKLKIPKNVYDFKIKASDLAQNPFVGVLQEISDIQLNKDLPFYLETSDIFIKGDIDNSSIKTELVSKGAKKLTIKLSLKIPKLALTGLKLTLCDEVKSKKCKVDALSASMNNVNVSLKPGRPVSVVGIFDFDLSGKKVEMKLKSISSNLDSANSPLIDIGFKDLIVPPIAIIVNGQRTELDTSLLKDKILEKKEFLAKKLLGFASEFVALDLAELVNKFLRAQNLSTSFEILNYRANYTNFELDPSTLNDYYRAPIDNTRTNIILPIETPKPIASNVVTISESQLIMNMIMSDFARMVQQMTLSLGVNQVLTPNNKDFELQVSTGFSMNGISYTVPNTIDNSTRVMAPLNLTNVINRQEHAQVVLSAPIINAALKVASNLKFLTDAVDLYDKEPGFWVNNAQVHMPVQDIPGVLKLKLVANSSIKLSDLNSNSIWEELENELGAWLERNNNHGVMYFPLEFELRLRMVKTTTGVSLMCKIVSPFDETSMYKNTYGYPSNLDVASKKVRNGVIKALKKRLAPAFIQEFSLDLTPFLDQKGIKFEPKSMKIVDSSYFILGLDLIKVDFKKLEGAKK
jgi:hypothetical protein